GAEKKVEEDGEGHRKVEAQFGPPQQVRQDNREGKEGVGEGVNSLCVAVPQSSRQQPLEVRHRARVGSVPPAERRADLAEERGVLNPPVPAEQKRRGGDQQEDAGGEGSQGAQSARACQRRRREGGQLRLRRRQREPQPAARLPALAQREVVLEYAGQHEERELAVQISVKDGGEGERQANDKEALPSRALRRDPPHQPRDISRQRELQQEPDDER